MASLLFSPSHSSYGCGLVLIFDFMVMLMSSYDVSVTTQHLTSRSASSLHKPSKELEELKLKEMVVAIGKQQFNATRGFSSESPATLAGLFPSEVRINFQGEPNIPGLRDDHVVPDLSSLATLLTLNVLVEVTVKTGVEKLPTANLVQAIESLGVFRSPSFRENRSALMIFWPVQTKGEPDSWTTSSENAVKGGVKLIPFVILEKAVKGCKDHCPLASQAVQQIGQDRLCLPYFNESLSDLAKRHNYPPDVTSSFANLALGALLRMGGDEYSSVSDVWKNKNANMTRLVDHVYQFAYKPLSSNTSNNVIDSRMYYVIEEYVSQRSAKALESLALVTYWIPQSSPEGRVQYGGQVLPTYNTIDLFATSTFLYAVTTAVLQKLIDYGPRTQTLVASNLDLMTWIVSNKRKDSLDILMTSHPSTFQFYWMLSRTMFELEKARVQGIETYQLFHDLYSAWNTTVRLYVTEAILNAIQDGGLDGDGNALAYVDDIMSPVQVEHEKDNKQPVDGNDRLFATASAASSLLTAWTVHDKNHQLLFLPGTPDDVALATKSLVNYVASEYRNKDGSLMNVIHSTLYKYCQSLSCYFPSNSVVTKNGTSFNGSQPTPEVLFGVRGHVPPEKYQAALEEQQYGRKTVSTLPAMDSAAAPFFFWSSPVYTQAMCLLAAGLMKHLEGQAQSLEELMSSFQKSG